MQNNIVRLVIQSVPTSFVASGVLCWVLLFLAQTLFAAVSLSISDTTKMDFATIAIPSSGSQNLVLNPSSSAETGTGTRLYGVPSRGVYSLKRSGNGNNSITIDIMNIISGSANLTLDAFTGVYNGTSI